MTTTVACEPAISRSGCAALGTGQGATWAPRLLAAYGVGLVAAGVFRAGPTLGFPPGTGRAR
jgi:hypothetical protein